jgi:hypothetical protein
VQHPRFWLRTVLLEVRKKSSIGEVLQARSIVSHVVAVSREVRGEVAVAVSPLVLAGQTTKVGRGPVG